MRRIGIATGIVLAVAGTVWLLQGLDVAVVPRSFMTQAREWVLIGAVTAAVGVAVAPWSWKRRRRPSRPGRDVVALHPEDPSRPAHLRRGGPRSGRRRDGTRR